MKILAIEQDIPNITSEQFTPELKKEEAKRVWELYNTGIFRELHFRQDKSCAILMLECDNVQVAQEILNTLPLVKAKLIDFEIIPLIPYPGFARLFESENDTWF